MELVWGFFAGVGQIILAHPLDTIKTWYQANHPISYNPRNLYRGFAYPLISNGIISSFAFQAYRSCDNYLIGGITSGIVTALTSYPFEYLKVRDQLKLTNTHFPKIGFATITVREILACTAYYPVYDYLKKKSITTPIAGGLAGMSCWLISYPADVVTTHAMMGKSLSTIFSELHYKAYFRGLTPALVRAFPVNALGFISYEYAKSILS